jgi:hypothetical protein
MANPTSNFGWQMPTPTDLVTDLPADFEVFGQAVDSSMADLLGGTTGQVLAKNSGTDMDFIWVAQDDSNAIQNAIVDAKGDLIAATANDTPARLAVGTDYGFLQADSGQSTGLLWNNAAWTSFTPVVTSATGSITSYTATAAYTRVGKLCVMRFSVTVTTAGTAAGSMYLTIPFNAVAVRSSMGVARETAAVGTMSSVTVTTSRLEVNEYDNSTPFGSGFTIVGTVSYEVA